MKRILPGLIVILACGGPAASTSGPTSDSPSTTSSSTTSPAASTTVEPTTTATAGPGSVPVVASRYGLMGWWSDGWVVPETLDEIPLSGGEEFQVVMLDQPITAAVGASPSLCEPSQTPVLDFDPPLPGEFAEPGALAVRADWELRPSPVRVEADLNNEHIEAVTEVLMSLGIESEPVLFQQIAADIDADGNDEIVIVSKSLPDDLFGRPGDYSVVVMRKMIEGDWQTAILETSLGEPDSPYVLSHSISAIADLNGDGRMEIAVDASYYEGSGSAAYEYVNDDVGPEPVLGGGCGA
ncbi:MAG TPA: VCBS repeat-containing protein [Acidimicrobiia bacterium]|nr:VCBS repeat-containing protein [Acidimicrobiia bacterium]